MKIFRSIDEYLKMKGYTSMNCVIENEKIYKPRIRAEELLQKKKADRRGDFKEVSGQESARRGAMIAAAGFHNLLMMGPPGVGSL